MENKVALFSGHGVKVRYCTQGRNHVFKVGGPIPWSRVLLSFYRKKLDRFTQFGAVGYIITLYSSKSYVKSWGSVQIWGVRTSPTPSGCAHDCTMLSAEIPLRQELSYIKAIHMSIRSVDQFCSNSDPSQGNLHKQTGNSRSQFSMLAVRYD